MMESLQSNDLHQVTQIANSAFEQMDITVLDCGFRRRTLAIVPSGNAQLSEWEAFTQRRPTLVIVPTGVDQPYMICEGDHIHPLALASRLAANFPDIDQAAGRLHARSDIVWRDLRTLAKKFTKYPG